MEQLNMGKKEAEGLSCGCSCGCSCFCWSFVNQVDPEHSIYGDTLVSYMIGGEC
jgi:hypothetical protein